MGPDDENGAANYVTPEQVSAAASLIKTGQSHGLGIVIESLCRHFPQGYPLQIVQPGQEFGRDTTAAYGWDMSGNDDVVQMWPGTGPQLDGLSHLGEAGEFYNCNRGEDFTQITGVTKLSLPTYRQGVLLDMAEHFGVEAMAGGQPITQRIYRLRLNSKMSGSAGRCNFVPHGLDDATLKSDPATWGSTIPGLTNAAAAYVASSIQWPWGRIPGELRPPAIAGDRLFYGHVTLLKENGIYSLETMDTGRLAREDVKEFMFVLGHAKLKGTVQMVINPVAMW